MTVTDEANASFSGSDAEFVKLASEAGMGNETTRIQYAGLSTPSAKEQITDYFSANGIAASAAASLGLVFAGSSDGNSIATTIDGSFLE
jgi:taurine transport system substrate-binding protein